MPSPATPILRFATIAHPHASNVRSGVAMVAKPWLGAAGCGMESKFSSSAPYRVEGLAGCAPSRSGKNPVVPDALRAIRDLDTQPSAIYKHYFRRPALDPGPRHETVIPD